MCSGFHLVLRMRGIWGVPLTGHLSSEDCYRPEADLEDVELSEEGTWCFMCHEVWLGYDLPSIQSKKIVSEETCILPKHPCSSVATTSLSAVSLCRSCGTTVSQQWPLDHIELFYLGMGHFISP